MTRQRATNVALALGSGGARGYAHIGAIQEIESRGLRVAGVSGSSMGAVVGALYAAGRLDDFTRWACSLNQFAVLKLLDPSLAEPGAIKGEKIVRGIRDILGDMRIEDLPVPFVAVATDLEAGRSLWFQRGPVDVALRASIAIPGIFTSSTETGRILADGGILDPLPTAATAGFGADLTIGVSLSGEFGDGSIGSDSAVSWAIDEWMPKLRRSAGLWSGPIAIVTRLASSVDADNSVSHAVPRLGSLGTMNRTIDVMQSAIARSKLASHPPDILVEVPRTACAVLDFHRAEEMIAVGRSAAARALDAAGVGAVPAWQPVRSVGA